jgi:hypothetical protein
LKHRVCEIVFDGQDRPVYDATVKQTFFSDATVEMATATGFSQSLPAVQLQSAAPVNGSGGNPFASTPVPAVTVANFDDVLNHIHARSAQDQV